MNISSKYQNQTLYHRPAVYRAYKVIKIHSQKMFYKQDIIPDILCNGTWAETLD